MRRSGFTLIELLIVSGIILILISFSTPLFRRTVTDLELKETAANIGKFITLAQQEAVIKTSIYKIKFDFENKKYRLFTLSGEGASIKYIPPQGRFGRSFDLPSSMDIEGQASEILFYPDGHCDKVELKLTSKNGKVIALATTGVMGNVVITEEKE